MPGAAPKIRLLGGTWIQCKQMLGLRAPKLATLVLVLIACSCLLTLAFGRCHPAMPDAQDVAPTRNRDTPPATGSAANDLRQELEGVESSYVRLWSQRAGSLRIPAVTPYDGDKLLRAEYIAGYRTAISEASRKAGELDIQCFFPRGDPLKEAYASGHSDARIQINRLRAEILEELRTALEERLLKEQVNVKRWENEIRSGSTQEAVRAIDELVFFAVWKRVQEADSALGTLLKEKSLTRRIMLLEGLAKYQSIPPTCHGTVSALEELSSRHSDSHIRELAANLAKRVVKP